MKGDFLGFSFDGIHCSELGITHVSSSDRYDEELFPEVRDKSVEIPHNHGEYYFGSTYGTRTFEIDIAYDSVTETQFRNIRRLFGQNKICELIFDERPYKVYYAKVESPIELSYICFDEQDKIPGPARDGVRVANRRTEEREKTISERVRVAAQSIVEYEMKGEPVGEPQISTVDDIGIEIDGTTIILTNGSDATGHVNISYTYMESYQVNEWEQVTPWEYQFNPDGSRKMRRIYKGEGTISLICYFPFARQLFKQRELYETSTAALVDMAVTGEAAVDDGNVITTYDNVDEWIESSGILTTEEFNRRGLDVVHTGVVDGNLGCNAEIPVYNPGDLNVGFCLYIPFNEEGKILPNSGNYTIINGFNDMLLLKPIKRRQSPKNGMQADTGILINTTNHLIEGVYLDPVTYMKDHRTPGWTITGTLYNDAIWQGDFPYIKRNDWQFDNTQDSQSIYINCQQADGIKIYYNYLYF